MKLVGGLLFLTHPVHTSYVLSEFMEVDLYGCELEYASSITNSFSRLKTAVHYDSQLAYILLCISSFQF